jgi:NADH dehydrogenase
MPSVLVVGGGYAGLRAALTLDRYLSSEWEIDLLDRLPAHQLLTRLPEVVGGRLSPDQAQVPFSRVLPRRVQLIQADVTEIDSATRLVVAETGKWVPDRLLVALGSVPSFDSIDGARSRSMVLRSVSDAVALRSAIQALWTRPVSPHVVVVGAGYTGTEVAGELVALDRRTGGAVAAMHVTIVAQDSTLLPHGNPELARVAERKLRDAGVRLILGVRVRSVDPESLTTEEGEVLTADVVVWAARSRAAPELMTPPGGRGLDDRVRVDPYLRAYGADGVYVLGDEGLAYDYSHDRPVAASAQLAVEEGRIAADNLVREIRGRPLREFRPRVVGEALSLGDDGVAELGGIVVTGRAALAVKQMALARYLAGLGGPGLIADYMP